MERLSDLRAGQITIIFSSSDRCGVYARKRLRQRFGDHASVLDVYLHLTQTCQWQREVGSRTPNVYGIGCRAKLDTLNSSQPRGLPSRT